jgi:hypothetical protein
MLAHLDLGSTTKDVQRVLTSLESGTEAMSYHRTSESAAASIGRWRTELPGELAELANADWAADLSTFGYV